ncbi:DUF1493 family protein [Duganella sp. CF517]|uniref:DUF1493 family protein n=1 Tax=Duganella sp. CF517 TaxID=1881038 RepID=UPI000B7F82BC|nr:DUF1493 family protein [Duganella sp. CF517]
MKNYIWNELENFVRKEVGVFPAKILKRDTSLEDDLDVTGDDSDIFMEKFFGHFQVNVGDFDIDRYFSGEGGGLLGMLTKAILLKNAGKPNKIPLTLGMLEKAIVLKIWDTKQIESGI